MLSVRKRAWKQGVRRVSTLFLNSQPNLQKTRTKVLGK